MVSGVNQQVTPCIAAKAGRSCPLWVKTGTFDPGRRSLYFRYTPKSGPVLTAAAWCRAPRARFLSPARASPGAVCFAARPPEQLMIRCLSHAAERRRRKSDRTLFLEPVTFRRVSLRAPSRCVPFQLGKEGPLRGVAHEGLRWKSPPDGAPQRAGVRFIGAAAA